MDTVCRFVVMVSLILGFPFQSISSQVQASSGSASWQFTGQAGGPTQGIAVQGSYAYLGVGPRLIVVDISDPANPHPVGFTAAFADLVQGVTITGAHAYVAAGAAGLRVIDISSPTRPVEVGAWDSPGFAENVTAAGTTVYLADGPYGLWLVDVSSPTVPSKISSAFEMNYVYDVAVNGRYAYLAAGGAGLLVADISNPAYPVELGSYDTPGNARAAAISGGRVYVADERTGLQIINPADPLHPVLLGSLQIDGWAFDVTVSGGTAYLAGAYGGLRIVDVLDPAHPLEVGSLSWKQSNAVGIAVTNGQAYLADRKNGLRVINVSEPVHPIQAGLFDLFQFAHMVVTSGDYAYVATGFNGVRIFNISDPDHPVEVASYQIDGLFYSLKLAGNRLYAGTMIRSEEGGVHVLDVSDPTHPAKIGYYADIAECWGMDTVGNILYVADAGEIKVVDFGNPANPSLLGTSPIVPRGITVAGGLAYVTVEYDGIKILDVSDPAHISQVGAFHGSGSFSHGSIPLAGGYAFVADTNGMRVIDVSNPTNPTEVSFTPTRGETDWVELSGNRTYLSEGSHGFSVFDVSDPSAPQLLSSTGVLGSVQTLTISGTHVYVAASEGGLQVFTEAAGTAVASPVVEPGGEHILPTQLPVVHRSSLPVLPQDAPSIKPEANRPAAVCTVTSTADSGSGTLRWCLENQVAGDRIIFSTAVFAPSAPATIQVGSNRLPWLSRGNVTIDASDAGVILDGTSVSGEWDPGIGINSDHNIVRGLQIVHFPGPGIGIIGHNNEIGGSRLVGSGPTGQGNVISGNGKDGIQLALGAQNNLIVGNLIGLDAAGKQAMGNQWCGVSINGARNNIVGSLTPGEENVISANKDGGFTLYGYDTSGNQIIGNLVGTDLSGTQDRGNLGVGVYIESGASNTLAQGNLISANAIIGVYVWDYGTDFNVLVGNRIGVNREGTQPLPNAGEAIAVGEAAYTRIGGTGSGEGNLVGSGNVEVVGALGAGTLVQGNRVGLNAAGTAVLPSAGGIILDGATRTIVGGATPAEANFITTSSHFSLEIHSPHNAIMGNYLGLALDGQTPLSTAGFQILSLSEGNLIQGNHMANAGSAGIWLDGAQTNTLRRNSIYANPFKGIFLDNGANKDLPAPNISLNAAGGSGTTCPGCTVELFLDEGNQGRLYLGSLAADGVGGFEFPVRCPVTYLNMTATATDAQGNTSPFSDPVEVPWDCTHPNPLPVLISMQPNSVKEAAATTLLTIQGDGFYPGSVARLNTMNLTTRYIDSTHLEAIVPVGQIGGSGSLSVTVFNPPLGGGTSNSLSFSIQTIPKIYLPLLGK